MIRLPPFRSRRALLLALVSLALAGTFAGWGPARNANAARKPGPPPVPVVLATAAEADVADLASGIGTVQALESATVRALVDGQVQKVLFTEGQDVGIGTALAQIDPAPFQAQVDQARAQKAKDEASLAQARADLARYDELLQLDAVPRQTFESQRAQVAQLEAAVQMDGAQLAYAKVQLDRTTVAAPIAGRTGVRLVDAGNVLRAAEATGIVVINRIDPISVVFTLPEDQVERVNRAVKEGAAAHAHGGEGLEVLVQSADDAQVVARGTLQVVNNQVDAATGTVQLKARFANAEHRLWPGQFVSVRLVLGTRRNALVLPASAVQRGPEGTFAYVVGEDGTVKPRALRVSLLQDGQAVIAAGLSAGEAVVAEGQAKLKPGSRVVDARAAAARDERPRDDTQKTKENER